MNKLEKLLIQLSETEDEIIHDYTSQEIKDAIEKLEKEKKIKISSTDLLNVLYTGVVEDIELDNFINSYKKEEVISGE